jgi:hypothetical protein
MTTQEDDDDESLSSNSRDLQTRRSEQLQIIRNLLFTLPAYPNGIQILGCPLIYSIHLRGWNRSFACIKGQIFSRPPRHRLVLLRLDKKKLESALTTTTITTITTATATLIFVWNEAWFFPATTTTTTTTTVNWTTTMRSIGRSSFGMVVLVLVVVDCLGSSTIDFGIDAECDDARR